MGSNTKRQTTMAKMSRERALREKRARKQEKKEEKKLAAAAALAAEAAGITLDEPVEDDETASDEERPSE
jgi:ABC-type branched-subunit amino acid transport system ATPase component